MMVLVKARDSGNQLVKEMPVFDAVSKSNPGLPAEGILRDLNLYPVPSCQDSAQEPVRLQTISSTPEYQLEYRLKPGTCFQNLFPEFVGGHTSFIYF